MNVHTHAVAVALDQRISTGADVEKMTAEVGQYCVDPLRFQRRPAESREPFLIEEH